MKLILLYPLFNGINNCNSSYQIKNQIDKIRHLMVTNLYLPFPHVRYLIYHTYLDNIIVSVLVIFMEREL